MGVTSQGSPVESRYLTSAILPKRLSCSASRGPALVFDRNLSSPNAVECRISESDQSNLYQSSSVAGRCKRVQLYAYSLTSYSGLRQLLVVFVVQQQFLILARRGGRRKVATISIGVYCPVLLCPPNITSSRLPRRAAGVLLHEHLQQVGSNLAVVAPAGTVRGLPRVRVIVI